MPKNSNKLSQNLLTSPHFWLVNAAGAGLVPKGPGTAGSLVAIPIILLIKDWPSESILLFWFLLFLVSLYSIQVLIQKHRIGDAQYIVIDEVLGMALVSAFFTPNTHSIAALLLAFGLFRFFDIVKPPPVRQLDNWSKKPSGILHPGTARWIQAFGIIADDLMAACQAGLCILILRVIGLWPTG